MKHTFIESLKVVLIDFDDFSSINVSKFYCHKISTPFIIGAVYFAKRKKRKGWDCTNRLNVTISFPISICIDGTLTESFSHNTPCKFRESKIKRESYYRPSIEDANDSIIELSNILPTPTKYIL